MEIEAEYEPSECPYCGSENVTCNNFDYESMSIEDSCLDCERSWDTIYNIVGVYIPDEYEGAYLIAHPTVTVHKVREDEFDYDAFHEIPASANGKVMVDHVAS